MILKNKKGLSALPVLLILGATLVEVVIVSVVLSNTIGLTRFNERLSAEAFGAARSGAQDAILRVIRDKDCPADPQCASYSLTVGDRTADVTISDLSGGVIRIRSTGTARLRIRQVEVLLGVSTSTGEVSLQSLDEVSF